MTSEASAGEVPPRLLGYARRRPGMAPKAGGRAVLLAEEGKAVAAGVTGIRLLLFFGTGRLP